jgi:hypothetical protein
MQICSTFKTRGTLKQEILKVALLDIPYVIKGYRMLFSTVLDPPQVSSLDPDGKLEIPNISLSNHYYVASSPYWQSNGS